MEAAVPRVALRRRGPEGAAWLFEGEFELTGDEVQHIDHLRRSWTYELHVTYGGGGTGTVRDPYSFGQLLSEESLRAFAAGSPCEAPVSMFGAHHVEVRHGIWGTRFAVWAPRAKAMSVVGDFNFWDGRAHPMCRRGAFGVW